MFAFPLILLRLHSPNDNIFYNYGAFVKTKKLTLYITVD